MKITEYEGIHWDEPGFVIASGSEGNRVSNEDFVGLNTIVVNDAFLRVYDAKYYVAQDPYVLNIFKNLRLQTREMLADKIFTPLEEDGEGIIHINRNPIPNPDYPEEHDKYPISFDLEEGMYFENTPAHTAFQLAIWMGMNPIFLFGVQFDGPHFYGMRPNHQMYDQTKYPRLAKTMSDGAAVAAQNDISVYNCSRKGRLHGLPYMEIKDAIAYARNQKLQEQGTG